MRSRKPGGIVRRDNPPCSPACLGFEQRPLRRLPRQILQGIGEVVAIMEQVDPTGTLLQQKREERRIGFRGVAGNAGENQVVGPVIGRLAAPGTHVVKRDDVG